MIAQPSDSAPDSALDPNQGNLPPDAIRLRIQECVTTLPPQRQQEVLDFVEFLAQKYQAPDEQSASTKRTIWDYVDEQINQLPDDAWEDSPTDGASQHDHYLCGTPKR